MIEQKEIIDLCKNFGNNQDLGRQYRKLAIAKFGKVDDLAKKYPNDFDLGNYLRKKSEIYLVNKK